MLEYVLLSPFSQSVARASLPCGESSQTEPSLARVRWTPAKRKSTIDMEELDRLTQALDSALVWSCVAQEIWTPQLRLPQDESYTLIPSWSEWFKEYPPRPSPAASAAPALHGYHDSHVLPFNSSVMARRPFSLHTCSPFITQSVQDTKATTLCTPVTLSTVNPQATKSGESAAPLKFHRHKKGAFLQYLRM